MFVQSSVPIRRKTGYALFQGMLLTFRTPETKSDLRPGSPVCLMKLQPDSVLRWLVNTRTRRSSFGVGATTSYFGDVSELRNSASACGPPARSIKKPASAITGPGTMRAEPTGSNPCIAGDHDLFWRLPLPEGRCHKSTTEPKFLEVLVRISCHNISRLDHSEECVRILAKVFVNNTRCKLSRTNPFKFCSPS